MARGSKSIIQAGSAAAPANAGGKETDERSRQSALKRMCLMAILAIFIVASVLGELVPTRWPVGFLLGIPSVIPILCWCIVDARQQGRSVSYPLQALILLLTPAGFIAYLLVHERTQVFGKALAFLLLSIASSGVASALAHRLFHGNWPVL